MHSRLVIRVTGSWLVSAGSRGAGKRANALGVQVARVARAALLARPAAIDARLASVQHTVRAGRDRLGVACQGRAAQHLPRIDDEPLAVELPLVVTTQYDIRIRGNHSSRERRLKVDGLGPCVAQLQRSG